MKLSKTQGAALDGWRDRYVNANARDGGLTFNGAERAIYILNNLPLN